jgi:hypothetical protein
MDISDSEGSIGQDEIPYGGIAFDCAADLSEVKNFPSFQDDVPQTPKRGHVCRLDHFLLPLDLVQVEEQDRTLFFCVRRHVNIPQHTSPAAHGRHNQIQA